jgi:hypothetical protein
MRDGLVEAIEHPSPPEPGEEGARIIHGTRDRGLVHPERCDGLDGRDPGADDHAERLQSPDDVGIQARGLVTSSIEAQERRPEFVDQRIDGRPR